MNISQRLQDAEQAHRTGQLDIAQKKYEEILTLDKHTDALYGLGTVFMQKKLYVQAVPLLQQAYENEPNAADIAYNLALCLVRHQEYDKALSVISSTIQNATKHMDIAIAFAQLAMNINAPQLSISLLKDTNNLSDQGKNMLAAAYMKTESWLSAKAIWLELSKKHPTVPVLFQNLSICATKLTQNQLAIDAYRQVIELAPSAENFIKFADLFLIIHDCAGAREQLNKAIKLGDTSVSRYEIECKVCRLENDNTATRVAAEKVILDKPDSYIAWQVMQELNDPEINKTCITNLTQLLSKPLTPSFEVQQNLFTLAKALEKEKSFTLAFTRFKEANELQYERFCQHGNDYQPLEIQTQYQRLRNIKYKVKSTAEKPSHIFVVGMPRSGTTLINRLLSQPAYAKSCNESNAAAIAFERELLNDRSGLESLASTLEERADNFYQTYQSNTGINADLIIDKMPHNFRFVGAILSTFPSAKIVQMRRDPQDLALSIYSHQFHEYHNYACKLPTIAHAIAQANQLMDFWCKTFPKQVIDIDYQTFVKTPVDIGKELFSFCNLNWNDDYLNFYKTAVPSYTFSEVQVRKPINTSKIAFSQNYHDQFEEFRRAYSTYYPADK